MIVTVILKILEKYVLCENGVIVQFVSHKKGHYGADEIYDDSVLVTPLDEDGEPNIYQKRYFHCSQFKNYEKREAFKVLAREHNIKTENKRFGIPIYIKGNYCTIQ